MLEERIVMKTNEEEDSRHIFRGELALVIAVMINSLAVILMLYSGSGISAISSVCDQLSADLYRDRTF